MRERAGLRWGVMLLGVLTATSALAQETVGRTAGTAEATATGAARYAMPLTLPPGTNGLEPRIAITYDSRGGNGLLGVGFRLEGLSLIRRCAATLAQDGRLAAVALDWPDRFCLDGQRLRLTAGSYGAAGSQYQTEVETFARVTALGSAGAGPASFRVERRDGLIYEYGATADARVESAGSSTPREWALNRIRDRDGNYADVVYAEDTASGAHRPLRIEYAGNTQTGAVPYYSVRFSYEPRPAGDLPTGYLAAGPVSEPWRLDRIDVVHVASGRVLRSFDLSYGTPGATGRSRLASVQECAGTSCFRPTQFGWTSVPAGWSVNMPVALSVAQYSAAIPGDIDGDGFDDLAYHDGSYQWYVLRGGPYGFQSPVVSTGVGYGSDASQAISADLDGDGRRDILVPATGNYLYWLRRTPGGTYAHTSIGVLNPAPAGGLVAADVDGDGRDDLVYVKSDGRALHWRRNQTVASASFAPEAVLWTVPADVRLPAAPFVESAQRFRSLVRSGDLNGDRRVDLVLRIQQDICGQFATCPVWVNRWMVLASTGTGLVAHQVYDGNTESLLADFNADGLTDIGFWAPGGRWYLLFGTGSRGAVRAQFVGPVPTDAFAPAVGGRAMVIDWDADGRTDILQPEADGEMRYCRSTGTSLEPCQPAGVATGTVPTAPMTLDINADGYPDLVYATSTVRLHLHHQVPPDMLQSATDGLGARSDFSYQPSSSGAVHLPGSGAVFPVRDVVRPAFLVASVVRTSHRGAVQERLYYEGAKLHVQGRGFLGFARRSITPNNTSLVRVEEYHQDPAAPERIGAPSRITVRPGTGNPVLQVTYIWGRRVFGTGFETRSFAYPERVVLDRAELDGRRVSSTVTDTVFDAFGTPLQRQVTTGESGTGINIGAQHVETTVLGGMVNDLTHWCLGRPASVHVMRYHSLPGGTQVTRSAANTWDYPRCRATQQIVEPSSATLRVATDYGYDPYGNVSSVRVTPAAEVARTTSIAWADNGRFPRTVTNPEGHVETLAWDGVTATASSSTDPNGLVTSRQYDGFGRLVRETRPDGTGTVVGRAFCGSACLTFGTAFVVTASERGTGDVAIATSETGFDGFERELYSRRELPGGGSSLRVLRYNGLGLVDQESVPGPCCATPTRWATSSYDALGRRTSFQLPAGDAIATPIVTRWRHDGLTVTVTDPLGRDKIRRHDALGRVVQVIDPARTDTDYEYDAFGNLVRVRDFAGAETVMSYDVRGLRRDIVDPSAGRWTFDYWPLGELRSQTNPRGQVTSFAYDRLARLVSRSEPEGTTTWSWGTSAASRNLGRLGSVAAPGFQEAYQYDALGRPATVTTSIAGATFTSRQTYDAASGLPDVLTYPASSGVVPLRLRHHYDRGRLVRLSDADSGGTYWQLNAVDSLGAVMDESLGNGLRVASRFDAVTGSLLSRTAGPGGGSAHQNLAFAWDAAGNLTQREERNRSVVEQFHYDNRDRLDYVTRGGTTTLDLAYDDTGNLTFKSDVGSYRYDTVRRQAVLAAGGNTYAYDANGAVVNASGTSIRWFSYDLPSQLNHLSGNYSAFHYGPDRARYRQAARAGGVLTETLYAAGGRFERVSSGSLVRNRNYIVADGRRVAVQTRAAGSAPVTVYLLEDHLGGVDGFVSSSGALLARTSYQPFGARRSGDWLGSAPTPAEWQQIQSTTSRGYTDHEHMDNLGVVHMNGRVYDPVLGRFLSPDPVVQSPYDTRGLNRYAYVRNNPLRYTDPSGHCFNAYLASGDSAPSCIENVMVLGPRFDGWAFVWWADFAERLVSFDTFADRGSLFGPGAGSSLEEVVVTGQRAPEPAPASADAGAFRSLWDLGSYLGGMIRSPYFDDLLLAGGMALALLEPTPAGEMAVGASLLTSESRALSTLRLTRPGETFYRYESGNAAFSRITPSGGVRVGTYAAPRADGVVPLSQRASVYNLPDPQILRTEVFTLRPPPNTIIIGPKPVSGGTGGEVVFPWGF